MLHTTDRQTTDRQAIAHSERELTFTFAKNAQIFISELTGKFIINIFNA